VIITPVTLMLVGLAFFHTLMASNNVTTIEAMHGATLKQPCVPDSVYLKKQNYRPHPYDKGIFANLGGFFDNDPWFWWLPSLKEATDEGTNHEPAPPINQYELALRAKAKGDTSLAVNALLNKKPMSLAEINYEEMFKKAEEAVAMKNLQFDETVHVYGKRNDNSKQ